MATLRNTTVVKWKHTGHRRMTRRKHKGKLIARESICMPLMKFNIHMTEPPLQPTDNKTTHEKGTKGCRGALQQLSGWSLSSWSDMPSSWVIRDLTMTRHTSEWHLLVHPTCWCTWGSGSSVWMGAFKAVLRTAPHTKPTDWEQHKCLWISKIYKIYLKWPLEPWTETKQASDVCLLDCVCKPTREASITRLADLHVEQCQREAEWEELESRLSRGSFGCRWWSLEMDSMLAVFFP